MTYIDVGLYRTVEEAQDIAEGKRSGYSIVNKFGENSAVSGQEDVWQGGNTYTGFPLGAAELVTVVSSDAGDDSDFSIRIYGLDADGTLQDELITLNGTTAVDSVNTYTRVFRGVIESSGNSNQDFTAGTITCAHKATTANVFFVMEIGRNQTAVACYTIPTGFTGYLKTLDVEMAKSSNSTAKGCLWIRDTGKSPRIFKNFTISQTSPYSTIIYGGIVLPALTDIAVRILSVSSGSIDVTANFDIVLSEDD